MSWVTDPDKKMVVSDGNGVVRAIWHDHYVQNSNGEVVPTDPPEQPYEAGRAVLSESNDFPANWRAAMDNGNLAVDASPSDIQAVKKI